MYETEDPSLMTKPSLDFSSSLALSISSEVRFAPFSASEIHTLDFSNIVEQVGWQKFVECSRQTFALENREKNLREWSEAGIG